MPCRCEGYENERGTSLYQEANDATRAACDMRTILRRNKLEKDLCVETREWIKKHDAEDAVRVAAEAKEGVRRLVKQQALDKLTLEERRVLGL